jgi:hypothetical protein
MSVAINESKRILNVGVVGCGEVAQIVHVRHLLPLIPLMR